MTSKQLISLMDKYFKSKGFYPLPHVYHKGDVVFYKELDNGFILTLGIERSNLYTKRITSSFYLSVSYTWGYAPPVLFPQQAYQRIGDLLRQEEREILLEKEYSEEGVVDAWWSYTSKDTIELFSNAVSIAEKHFLDQDGIFKLLLESAGVCNYMQILRETILRVQEISDNNEGMLKSDVVHEVYCQAAKEILSKRKDIRNNKDGVRLVAIDAWSCYNLSSHKNRELIGII